MKTKEELNALKEEVETVSKKLRELTDEELAHVTGGAMTVTIRGMEVTNYNIQNGGSTLKVSEGDESAMNEIIRTLKEKINAVNDTNTDVDRNAIQKEEVLL